MRRWMTRQAARLIAADPGLRRLRAAARVVIGVIVALAVLVPALTALGQSPLAAALGAVIALVGQLAVLDTGKAAQAVTTLLLPVSAAASLLVASLLSGSAVFGELVFVLVMFVATYVRRFGTRAGALGMVAFVSFFLALFLRVHPVQVPAMAVSGAVGACAALLARFVVLPERPERVWRSGVRALRARVRTLLDAMDDRLEQPNRRRGRRVHDELMRLNETALAVEGDLDALAEGSSGRAERLRRQVLDIELAAEHLVTALRAVFDESQKTSEVRHTLARLGAMVRHEPRRASEMIRQAAERTEADGFASAALTLRRLSAAAGDLTEATLALLAQERAGGEESEETEAAREDAERAANKPEDQEDAEEEGTSADEQEDEQREKGLRHTTRAAVQVACAGAAAIVLGGLISETRWYWAVITAFVVFAGTGSRGELLIKAWRRTVGTLFGVVFGVGVALLVSGSPLLQLGVVLCCVFMAFYLMSVSYALMTFFITAMLGVLYEILGRFSIYVLEVRLVETAVGAAAGIAAALLVLPARTRTVVRESAEDLLRGLHELLRNAATDLEAAEELRDLAPDTRTVDARMQTLLASASPLGRYRVGTSRASYERWRLLISSSAYYSRDLTVTLPPAARMADDDTRSRLAALIGTLAELAETISMREFPAARELIEQAERQERALIDTVEVLPPAETSLRGALHTLGRLRGALTDLADTMRESRSAPGKTGTRVTSRPV